MSIRDRDFGRVCKVKGMQLHIFALPVFSMKTFSLQPHTFLQLSVVITRPQLFFVIEFFRFNKFCQTQTYLLESHRITAIGTLGNVEPVQLVLRPGQIVVGADLLDPGALIVPVGGILQNLSAVVCHWLCVTSQRVPLISAELPRQLGLDASEGVEERPCYDHVVVDGDKESDKKHAVALE